MSKPNMFANNLRAASKLTETENGAPAYSSTMSKCLDAFGSMGAMRGSSEADIISMFSGAFEEDRATAMKILFYMRDIREGQGTRRVFRVVLKWLAENYSDYVVNNLDNILFFGRGDDFLCLIDTNIRGAVCNWLLTQITKDTLARCDDKPVSLLAKWLPSENTSSKESRRYARIIMTQWSMSPKNYRRLLVDLRKHIDIVEARMSANDWQGIDYNGVPGKAMTIYRGAFNRHDGERFGGHLTDVALGKAKVNAGALYPADIVHTVGQSANSPVNRKVFDAMWKALPDYFDGHESESALVMADVSGSMLDCGRACKSGISPMDVSVSLAIYCASKCKGPFKDMFMTFTSRPDLVCIDSTKNIVDIVEDVRSADWGGSTNLAGAMQLILDTAIYGKCSNEDLPKKLYIISDMQFDNACTVRDPNELLARRPYHQFYISQHSMTEYGGSLMQQIRKKFEDAGYTMPNIVYWNVRASHCGMFQESRFGTNCAMVSGYSAQLFKAVMEGTTYVQETKEDGSVITHEIIDPMTVMMATINNDRYARVWAQ